MIYLVYERSDEGTTIIGTIRDGRVSGEKAAMIRQLLKEGGYPKKENNPERILHGSRLWAARNQTQE